LKLKEQKEGGKEGRKEGRDGRREEGSTEARKHGSKEARKQRRGKEGMLRPLYIHPKEP